MKNAIVCIVAVLLIGNTVFAQEKAEKAAPVAPDAVATQLHPANAPPADGAAPVLPDRVASDLNPAAKAVVYPYAIHNLMVSPSGKKVAGGNGWGEVLIWDFATGDHARFKAHENWAFSVRYSADGEKLLTGGGDNLVHLFDADDLKAGPIQTLKGHTADVHAVAFHPKDENIVFSAGDDETAIIWNLKTGKPLHTLEGHERQITSLDVSPDGRILATGSRDGTIRLWTTDTGEHLRTLKGHEKDVMSVRFSPDGQHLVSGSYDASVRFWDIAHGKLVHTESGFGSPVVNVNYSPNGLMVAATDQYSLGRIEIKNGAYTLKALGAVVAPGGLLTNEDYANSGWIEHISWVTFTPDGQHILASSLNALVHQISTADGRTVRALKGPRAAPTP